MSNKGRDCFRGAQCGNDYMTGHKMYMLKSYIALKVLKRIIKHYANLGYGLTISHRKVSLFLPVSSLHNL